MFAYTLGFLFFFQGSGMDYENIYNFKSHSYYLTKTDWFTIYFDHNCAKDSNYAAIITSSDENDAVSSVLRKNRIIGIYKDSNGQYIIAHTHKTPTYTNFDSNAYDDSKGFVRIISASGKWELTSFYSNEYAICESDSISSSGINITNSKIINTKYDQIVTYRGHSYYIYGVYRKYQTILQICKHDHNGYIFIPNDGLENCAINTKYHKHVYVGITNIMGNYITDKGDDASYLPWEPGQPKKEICVSRSHENGEFSTESCNGQKHIICEIDSVINGATTVDCDYTRIHFYFAQIFQYKEDYFRIFDFETSKDEAKKLCERREDVLFVPLDEMENCAIMENSESTLGLNYGQNYVKHILTRGDYYSSNYTNWADGYPKNIDDNICVYAYYDSGKWKNSACISQTFACREIRKGETSTISCTKDYLQTPNNSYTINVYEKYYSLFSRMLNFHDSARLCSFYGLTLIQTTDSYVHEQIIKNIVSANFHLDYRIYWNDTTVNWVAASPDYTNWAPGEPISSDFYISCVSVTINKTWVTNSCHQKYIPVCVGSGAPTLPSTASKTTSTTTTTTSTTTTSTSTTASSTTTTALPKSNPAASKNSNKVGVGVGAFFGVVAFACVIIGVFFFMKKRGIIQTPTLSSFGSFKKHKNTSVV